MFWVNTVRFFQDNWIQFAITIVVVLAHVVAEFADLNIDVWKMVGGAGFILIATWFLGLRATIFVTVVVIFLYTPLADIFWEQIDKIFGAGFNFASDIDPNLDPID